MNFNQILVWIVCFSCGIYCYRAICSSIKNNIGWIIISSSIFVLTLIFSFLYSDVAGYVGGFLWFILLFLPMMGFSFVNQLVFQQRYHEARKLSTYLRWLHPLDGWLEQPGLLLALEMAKEGKFERATQIIKYYEKKNSPLFFYTWVLLYSIKADWENLLTWIQNHTSKSALFNQPKLFMYYIRCLGEMGELNHLLQELEMATPTLEKSGDKISINLVRMFALAFSGKTESVKLLLNNSLKIYPEKIKRFWFFTAQMAAGNLQVSRQGLLELRLNSDLILNNAIEQRLCDPILESKRQLSLDSIHIINNIETKINREIKCDRIVDFRNSKADATYVLIAVNLIFFILEYTGGGFTNEETLTNLGALIPQAVKAGEWWRLLNANFLHFGWIHLLSNIIALYFLGKIVEPNLGRLWYLITYFVSGIGAMIAFTFLAEPDQILIGASGAIMGLIGAILAIFLKVWRKDNSRIARQRMLVILFMVGLQFAFDLANPQVSFLCHLFGFIIGFITVCLLLIRS